ncbi:MAG: DNA recombination protein RmuC [Verrucomicrobia bacterium]|nr:DNA recombination protein RmuC [Verrucomicrobiota bacterium]MBU6446586.1 DNA recombination protein RmuC [Verrucomicrobiota bacterium]MDE3047860.1 DNA recombination protein RmuC [Verrucomicrobiota bacterium]
MLVLLVCALLFAMMWLWMGYKFKTLSLDALEKSGKQFMHLADHTLQPLQESVKWLNEHQRELEKRREGAYASLSKQIESLVLSEKELRAETTRLTQALKSPQIRGSWGEVHLKRVVELAGMVHHCDFYEQKTLEGQGRILRPDLVVHLPGQRQIAVDAKTPLNAYLEAADLEDDLPRKYKLQEHAASVRKHIKELSAKEYWKQFDSALEYVILFLPAEAFFSAALQADPSLIEIGAEQNIIVATPTTLIAILRAVAHGWKQENLSKSAREMAKLGSELYERVGIVCEHWNQVGKSLNRAVESYNQSIASLETRVLVSARKLKETGSLTKELPPIESLEKIAREISGPV